MRNIECMKTKISHYTMNVTQNSTTGEQLRFSEGLKICLYVFYSIILVVGILGNGLVCYVLIFKKKRKNTGDIFIISLAMTDFISSIFIPLVQINDLVGDAKIWYLGEIGCFVLPAMFPMTLTASSWLLVLISLDRYR